MLALGALVVPASAQSLIGWGSYSYVPAAAQSDVWKLASVSVSRIALKLDGSVVTWSGFGGNPSFGPASVHSGVTAVATSGHHFLAVKNGGVIIWGGNDSGGGETTVPGYATSGVTAVGGGNYHSMALVNGEVKVWGYNVDGICNVPVAAQSGVVAIASGYAHCVALTSGGQVVAWGSNYQGLTDVPVAAQSGVVAIASSGYHIVALKADGSVVAWGSNYEGQCNVPASALSHVALVGAGSHHSYAVKDDGSIVAFGFNSGGIHPPVTAHDISYIGGGEFTGFAIRAPFPAESLVAPTSILAGASGTATVTLATPAPVGGATVALSVDDSGVHVPATVTVPEGDTSATYPVATDLWFGGERAPTITTTYGGEAHTTRFYIFGHAATLSQSRTSVIAGSDQSLLCTLTIDAPLAVPVTFDVTGDTGFEVPATVKIPAGKTSVKFKAFTNTDLPTGSYYDEWDDARYPYVSSVYARYQGNGPGISVTAEPITATLDISRSAYAGQYVSGLVKLNVRPRSNTTVVVSTDDPAIPAFNVDVVAGAGAASFNLLIPSDATTHSVNVTASLNGTDSTKTLNVIANQLTSISVSPTAVQGGNSATGTVSVRYPVAVDTVVALALNKPGVTVPATVTIPAGSSSVTFTVSTAPTHISKLVRITATKDGKSVKINLTVNP